MEHGPGREDQSSAGLIDSAAYANCIKYQAHLVDTPAHRQEAQDVTFADVNHEKDCNECALWWLFRSASLLQHFGDKTSPSSLMAGADAGTVVAIEVLIE